MIAHGGALDQRVLDALREHDSVVRRYRAFFAHLDWRALPTRAATRPRAGPVPHPPAAYVKALLIKLCERKEYITAVRSFLVEHPLLVLEIGFHPALDPAQPYGFDAERTVPGARWLRHVQQYLDNALLHALLRGSCALHAEIPGLGETVAFDVKHIYAWVGQNNPTAYVPHRYDPERQPTGDPDCRLDMVHLEPVLLDSLNSRKQSGSGHFTPTAGHFAPIADSRLSSPVEPCLRRQDEQQSGARRWHDQADQGVYVGLWQRRGRGHRPGLRRCRPRRVHPALQRGRWRLLSPALRAHRRRAGGQPTNVTADAAFDAWHIYETCADRGGIAAIPLNTRGHPTPQRLPDGTPLCPRAWP